jgi:lipopolysaccharide transport system permease protein
MSVEHIDSKTRLFDLKLNEIWQYRDLVIMFVRRDLAATYKQSILGPMWFFIQPLLTALTYSFIFGKVAGISTDGLPKIIFYLAGITIWSYFSECFTKTATVLKDNSALFGKVYFPRLILPLSICLSALTRFGIQFLLFSGYVLYYTFAEHAIQPNLVVFATPFLLVLITGFGLGGGILISSLTTRYRDLSYLITFGVQLLMFATPIIYTVDRIDPAYRKILMLNPLSPIIETFRYAYLGVGNFSLLSLLYSFFWMIILLFTGIVVFNKVQKTFMDTI